jgi:hypothetical protein
VNVATPLLSALVVVPDRTGDPLTTFSATTTLPVLVVSVAFEEFLAATTGWVVSATPEAEPAGCVVKRRCVAAVETEAADRSATRCRRTRGPRRRWMKLT